DLYRLTTADNPVQEDEGFTYDMVGNRLTAANTTGDWAYNGNNELLSSSALTGQPDPAVFEYDANGNTIKKTVGSVVTSYVYNLEDRLTQVWNGEVSTGSLTAEYYYDPFGRRLWKEVAGVRTCFHYADEGLTAEMDSAGTITKTYGYKPGSTWTTDPLFMKVGAEYYFYHTDHLGTPQKMTGTNGAVVWSAKYSSFGEANVEIGTLENNLRFPGQYYDGESGLHYNRHRYYEASTGRYLANDTIGLAGGINLFAYVLNDPVNFVDPHGLFVGAIGAKVIGRIIGKTAQEIAVVGKMADGIVALVLETTGVAPNIGGLIGYVADGLQIQGGVQLITLGGAIAAQGIVAPAIPIAIAGGGGVLIGLGFNNLYERISGQSLGEDIYDWEQSIREWSRNRYIDDQCK
ncbi:RHS domain-containing protein, partial [Patescibacteria group bacterium]|nr:RHS domain-containing protein [Patescibacteria group bacterium]